MTYGGLWYLDDDLFETTSLPSDSNITIYQNTVLELKKEFFRSQEIFIQDQRRRYPNDDADAWKILEVASMGTLSKL
ncbi:MAG: Abi family protein [Leadbetterella sp.]|nr:Abi family protein [Leadbetterella sp.]